MSNTHPRPGFLAKPENIPQDIRTHFGWTMYALNFLGGKYKKMPVHWRNGFSPLRKGEGLEVGTFDEVAAAMRSDPNGYYGIGIVLTREANALCFDADTSRAFDMLDGMNAERRTYCETSISGKGRHYLWGGRLPHDRGALVNHSVGIEVYAHDRFIAITGDILPQGNGHLADASDLVAALFANVAPPATNIDTDVTTQHGQVQGLPDSRVISVLRDYYERGKQRALWDDICSTDDLTNRRSDVFFRVASDLDRIVGDPAQVWRIMLKMPMIAQNGHNREKFERDGLFDGWIKSGRAGTSQGITAITVRDYGDGYPSIEHGKAMGAELGIARHMTYAPVLIGGEWVMPDETPPPPPVALAPVERVTFVSLYAEAQGLNGNMDGNTAVDVENLLRKIASVHLSEGEVAEILDKIAQRRIAGLGIVWVRATYGKLVAQIRNERKANSDDWRDKLDCNTRGEVYSNLSNALILLDGVESFTDVLLFDEFMNAILIEKRPPWENDDGTPWVRRELVESDLIKGTAFIQRMGLPRIGKDIVTDAIITAAQSRTQNCVVEKLDAIRDKWDGVRRLDTWPMLICGVTDTPVNRAMAARWWIGLCARARDPGCKFDNVLALEGMQGRGKSTLFETIAGYFDKDFYLEFTGDISDKDSLMMLRGRLIVEFGEGHSLKGKAGTQTKPFISRKIDTYRPPYGRLMGKFPRTFGWGYTGNDAQYLNDPTGARRMWPMEVTTWVDVAGMVAIREQLWAEADARYRTGERWWIDPQAEPELDLAAKAVVDQRFEEDVWQEEVERYLLADATGAFRTDCEGRWREGFTAAEVLRFLGLKDENMTQVHKNRVGSMLRRMGYFVKSMRVGGVRGDRYCLLDRVKRVI